MRRQDFSMITSHIYTKDAQFAIRRKLPCKLIRPFLSETSEYVSENYKLTSVYYV